MPAKKKKLTFHNFGIEFGSLSPPLTKQLRQQGCKFDLGRVQWIQKWLDSINVLRMAGLMKQGPYYTIQKAIMRSLNAAIVSSPKSEPL